MMNSFRVVEEIQTSVASSDASKIVRSGGATSDSGSIANLVGPGALYMVPPAAKVRPGGGTTALLVPGGWLKVAAKAPGVQVRAASSEVTIVTGAVVLQTDGAKLDIFVESGEARIAALAPSGAEETARNAKHDEFWSKSASGTFVASTRPPKAFIDAMPRHQVRKQKWRAIDCAREINVPDSISSLSRRGEKGCDAGRCTTIQPAAVESVGDDLWLDRLEDGEEIRAVREIAKDVGGQSAAGEGATGRRLGVGLSHQHEQKDERTNRQNSRSMPDRPLQFVPMRGLIPMLCMMNA